MPYALGRPLGSAEDPEFQKEVMRASLAMLYTATEPTIEDYPIEAPTEAGPTEWSCPLNLATGDDGSLTGRLLAEVARLRPWSEETRRSRGRTLFGASGATPDDIDDVASALASIAESGDVTGELAGGVAWTSAMPLLIRHLADDLRTFYHEAVAAQPGAEAPNHEALTAWIFAETVLGETFQAIAEHLTEVEDSAMSKLVRGFLIPEGHFRGGSAFG